jgi:hypothetical protein
VKKLFIRQMTENIPISNQAAQLSAQNLIVLSVLILYLVKSTSKSTMFKKVKTTRSDTYLVSGLHSPIKGSKLPSIGQALGRFLYMSPKCKTSRDSASVVADEVLSLWNHARIPTKRKDHIIDGIIGLNDNYRLVKKHKSRTTATQQANEQVSLSFFCINITTLNFKLIKLFLII